MSEWLRTSYRWRYTPPRPTVHETLTALALYVCAISASLMLWHELLRLVRWVWL